MVEVEQMYKVGDRVMYKALFNNPGHYGPGEMLLGEVVCRYLNGDQYMYKIRLDKRWSERVAACGEHIVVGNICVTRLSLAYEE